MVQEPEMAAAAGGRFRDRDVVKSGKAVLAKTGFSGPEDGLCPVGYLELGEDVGDVVAHGLGAHVQEFGNFGVVVALGYEVEHLALAGGELGEGFCGRGWLGGGEKVREATGDLRPEIGIAFGHGADHLQDIGGIRRPSARSPSPRPAWRRKPNRRPRTW